MVLGIYSAHMTGIFEILKLWGKCFEVDFAPEISQNPHVCSTCFKKISLGPHVYVAQKLYWQPKSNTLKKTDPIKLPLD